MSKVRLFGHSLLWVFTVSVVALAILLVIARLLITQIPAYKNDLEVYLSDEIGAQVSIGKMSAAMDGFRPQLRLTEIQLDELKNQSSTLHIGEIRLAFDPLGFVLGEVSPNKIIIINTSISIKRFSDGHVSIVGLSDDKNSGASSGDFSWLLEDGDFEVINSQLIWQDDMRDLPDVTLKNANVIFRNSHQEHALKMTAELPGDTQGTFTFSINVTGDVLTTNEWNAEGYLNASNIDVDEYFIRLKVDEFSVKQGVANLEMWSTWNNAELVQVKGNTLVNDVKLLQLDKELELSSLESQFDWQKTLNGWSLKTQNFSFKNDDENQEKSQFAVQYEKPKGAEYTLTIAADGINLKAISDVVRHSNILEAEQLSLLHKTRLSGTLNTAWLKINANDELINWAACGTLKGFSSDAYEQLPSIENFSGILCSTQDKGWLDVDMHKGSVDFKGLFRDPIVIEDLEGRLTWFRAGDGLEIKTDRLALKSPHIATTSRIDIKIPTSGASPIVDLQTNFGKADARSTSKYLPVGIMSNDVVEWLDEAFIEGEVVGGGLVLKGELNDFPYRHKEGIFQVLFDVDGLNLHYANKWPDVINISTEVEFKNQGLKINAHKGHISANRIKQAFVGVSDLENDKYLIIDGVVEDDISGLYRFFKQSPLKSTLSTLLDISVSKGPAVVDLNIKIPLLEGLETDVEAQATLTANTLTFPDYDVVVEGINGVLTYNKHGLAAKSLAASVFGEKTKVDIRPDDGSTVINALGNVNVATLAKKYPSTAWKEIHGSSRAQMTINLPNAGLTGDAVTSITLKSDLKGIAVDLPQPLGKDKGTPIPFELMTVLGQETLPLTIAYGEQLQGVFQFIENTSNNLEFAKGDIRLGKVPAKLPVNAGMQLSGVISHLNIGEWQKALDFGADTSVSSSMVNQLNLGIGELNLLDTSFNDVQLTGQHSNDSWSGEISSPVIIGQYHLPDELSANKRITLELKALYLPETETIELDEKRSPLSPDNIPNVDLRSEKFFIGESNLGQLELQLRQKDNGMIIQKLSLNSERDELIANGAWEIQDGQSRTGLIGKLSSKSLGSLLKETGITSKLKDAPTDINFDLHWPGEPQEFSKNHLSGFAQIKSGKGRLLDVEPGIGRVFGLLSLSTLQRRLQLDFSDLVQKGMSFDKIKGRLVIVDGEAQTNRFYLESPSARLDFQGRIGLATEDVDQLVTVTPNTTESLPVAGAIAGGPLVGAAIFLVQKIAGKTVNKFAGYQYRVTGPWGNPKIEQISQPGGKIFGFMDNILTPVFDATIGRLPLNTSANKQQLNNANK
ncbi:MAG: TIGR02099 family protein [Cycloclasticus sp.]|nr:MAG: TIGR02099 family protein [Cycloclasticus sp.]